MRLSGTRQTKDYQTEQSTKIIGLFFIALMRFEDKSVFKTLKMPKNEANTLYTRLVDGMVFI